MTQLFSLAALFIMYRESVEAAVVLSIMLQLLNRLNYRTLKRQVWWGVFAGIGCSAIVGVVFIVIFYVLGNKVFSGNPEMIFKATILILASLLITALAFALLKFMNYEKKWERKLASATEQAATGRQKYAIFFLAFVTVLREGMESVLFLTGVSSGTGVQSIIIPGILGVILGILTGIALWMGGRQIRDLKWFFIISSVLLFFIAAGLMTSGFHNLQLLGALGTWYPYYRRPWFNRYVFHLTCCNDATNDFWVLMRAMFGYQDRPTSLELIIYFCYWIVVILFVIYRWCNGTLLDAEAKHRKREAAAAAALGGKPVEGEKDVEVGVAGLDEVSPKLESSSDGASGSGSDSGACIDDGHHHGLEPSKSTVRRVEEAVAQGGTEAPPKRSWPRRLLQVFPGLRK